MRMNNYLSNYFFVMLLIIIIVIPSIGQPQKQQIYGGKDDIQPSWELYVCDNSDYVRNFLSEFSLDDEGNVYITGACGNSTSGTDLYTAKITNNGVLEWEARYRRNSECRSAKGLDIVLDTAGNVYVAGVTCSEEGDKDFTLLKLNPDGTLNWDRIYNSINNLSDVASKVELDPNGDIIVAGYSFNRSSDSGYIVIKYAPNGEKLWQALFNGAGDGEEQLINATVDTEGSTYLIGFIDTDPDTLIADYDYSLVKYNSDGEFQWVSYHAGDGTLDDWGNVVKVHNGREVYLAGSLHHDSSSYDFGIFRLDSMGNEIWKSVYNGPGNDWDEAPYLEIDQWGDVYVAGIGMGQDQFFDFTLVKYNSSGEKLWDRIYSASDRSHAQLHGLALDDSGNVYVTGISEGSFVTIKYSSLGEQLWLTSYSNFDGVNNGPRNILLDSRGEIYIAGNIHQGSLKKFVILKYEQIPVSVEDKLSAIQEYKLLQNYPNPFNPRTKITYHIPAPTHVKLTIFDILGRVVATLVDDEKFTGHHEIVWDASEFSSGVYFSRLTTGSKTEIVKILLLK